MDTLFLDDNEQRQARMRSALPSIIQARTADEAIDAIKLKDQIAHLFLDHDLGGEIYVDSNWHNTGMTVAKWLIKNKRDINKIIIHSFNPAGVSNMYNVLKDKYNVVVLPFLSRDFCEYVVNIVEKEK